MLFRSTTASEINNDYFEVQRSRDNQLFETIDKVDGAGSSTFTLNYKDVDMNPYNGVSYYRLRQVDYDGKASFSPSVPVRINSEQTLEFLFSSQSEAGDNVVVGFFTDKPEPVSVRFTDVLGNKIFETVMYSDEGFNKNEIHIPGLPSAIYFVTLSNSDLSLTKKIFIN